MVKNEVDIVEDWLKYHGTLFGYNNLNVLDVAKEVAGAAGSTKIPIVSTIGKILEISPGMRSLCKSASRARIQFLFPLTVLISPLCAINL